MRWYCLKLLKCRSREDKFEKGFQTKGFIYQKLMECWLRRKSSEELIFKNVSGKVFHIFSNRRLTQNNVNNFHIYKPFLSFFLKTICVNSFFLISLIAFTLIYNIFFRVSQIWQSSIYCLFSGQQGTDKGKNFTEKKEKVIQGV